MPELPEVATTIKGLNPLIGLKVYKVNIHTKKIRYIVPKGITKIQEKSRITNISRISKYILINFSSNFSLIFHLGMSGRLKLLNNYKLKDKHDHLVISFQNSKFLIFNDPRRFGFVDFDETNIIYTRKYLSILGIDALSNHLNNKYLSSKINKSEVAIKQILLNQQIIAGIGNIYASEILFESRISPFKKGKDLQIQEISKLIISIRKILKKAIRYGGSSIRDYVSADGTVGNFQSNFKVYGKEGKKTSNCIIKKDIIYGRSTYYCPKLQK
tara:strand:- start:126 stop:938 length:813 start_codon:yes stop_codon:yes gene_type:complete